MLAKKGRSGYDLLIMFIVVLVISSVAAAVLIIVNNKFSEKMLITGKAAKDDASAEIELIDVYAEDGSLNKIDYFFLTFKIGPSSESTNLNMTFFGINLNNASGEYRYTSNASCDNPSTLIPGVNYATKYLIKGRDHLEGRVSKGDVITMCFRSPRTMHPGELFKIHIVTITGSRILFDYQLPDILHKKRSLLYP